MVLGVLMLRILLTLFGGEGVVATLLNEVEDNVSSIVMGLDESLTEESSIKSTWNIIKYDIVHEYGYLCSFFQITTTQLVNMSVEMVV